MCCVIVVAVAVDDDDDGGGNEKTYGRSLGDMHILLASGSSHLQSHSLQMGYF